MWNFLLLCIFHGWLMIQVSSNITVWEVTTSKTMVLKIILSIFSFKFLRNLFLVIESVIICIYLDWFIYLRVCGSECVFSLFSVIVSWHQLYCLISLWILKSICWANPTYDQNYQPTYIQTSYGIHGRWWRCKVSWLLCIPRYEVFGNKLFFNRLKLHFIT